VPYVCKFSTSLPFRTFYKSNPNETSKFVLHQTLALQRVLQQQNLDPAQSFTGSEAHNGRS
jgi:hypothetical protein